MEGLNMLEKLQDAVIQNITSPKTRENFKYDKLQMYFGRDFNYQGIVISQPKIGDVLDIGEDIFFNSISPFLYNSTSIRVPLWDMGIDWNKISDIETFFLLMPLVKDKTPLKKIFNISFDDFELRKLTFVSDSSNDAFCLYSPSQNIFISEEDYMVLAGYIREVFSMHPKVEKAKGKTAKSWIIQEEKMNIAQKGERSTSTLLPLISFCINHPGFKYKLNELEDVGIYQFMDSVKRLNKYENGTAALKGIYSGFVNAKDIDKETLNLMGEI